MIHAAQAMDVGWKGFFCSFGLASYLTLTAAGHRSGEGRVEGGVGGEFGGAIPCPRELDGDGGRLDGQSDQLEQATGGADNLAAGQQMEVVAGQGHPPGEDVALAVGQDRDAGGACQHGLGDPGRLRVGLAESSHGSTRPCMWSSYVAVAASAVGLPGRSTTQHCWPTTITRERAISCKNAKVDR